MHFCTRSTQHSIIYKGVLRLLGLLAAIQGSQISCGKANIIAFFVVYDNS